MDSPWPMITYTCLYILYGPKPYSISYLSDMQEISHVREGKNMYWKTHDHLSIHIPTRTVYSCVLRAMVMRTWSVDIWHDSDRTRFTMAQADPSCWNIITYSSIYGSCTWKTCSPDRMMFQLQQGLFKHVETCPHIIHQLSGLWGRILQGLNAESHKLCAHVPRLTTHYIINSLQLQEHFSKLPGKSNMSHLKEVLTHHGVTLLQSLSEGQTAFQGWPNWLQCV